MATSDNLLATGGVAKLASPLNRRAMLRQSAVAATLLAALPNDFAWAFNPQSQSESPFDGLLLWRNGKQIVYAYPQGETFGVPCRRLDEQKGDLPVEIVWRPAPTWVEVFPTIQFQTSSGSWELQPGWDSPETFVKAYDDFNPPPQSSRQISPFKAFVKKYFGPHWRYPGGITNHLLDPNGPHRFSEYELRGLKTSEKKRLHSAHHQGFVAPGRRPPDPEVANLTAWQPSTVQLPSAPAHSSTVPAAFGTSTATPAGS